jgi:beta-hydroxylase
MTAIAPSRPSAIKRLGSALSRLGRRLEAGIEGWMARKSLVETSEILSPASFPWVADLEANWTTIRRELEGVIGERASMPNMQDLSPLQYSIVKEKVWKVFSSRAYGVRSEGNCRACPETARLIDAIPGLEVAFFSVLEPGAHLAAHRGAYKGLVRTHLGLMVPEPREKVRMQVGKETVIWEEGRCVVFDDTYRHEVWNDTDGVRVVLLIDTPRPFPPAVAWMNRQVLKLARLTPEIGGAVREMKAWEKARYPELAKSA